jgi:hypothetical protein
MIFIRRINYKNSLEFLLALLNNSKNVKKINPSIPTINKALLMIK